MPDSSPRPALSSALSYRDPKAAILWLEQAFGFEQVMVILDKQGGVAHAELRHGDGLMMLGGEWSARNRSPASVEGLNTQTVHVHLREDVDAHCARARRAGADILQEPETQFYGDRSYRCADPEGHIWTFAQTVREVSPEEWDKSMGFVTKARL